MIDVYVHSAYIQGSVCSKQRNEDQETKRQRDKFDSNSVETIDFAGHVTKHHDAHDEIENGNKDAGTMT